MNSILWPSLFYEDFFLFFRFSLCVFYAYVYIWMELCSPILKNVETSGLCQMSVPVSYLLYFLRQSFPMNMDLIIIILLIAKTLWVTIYLHHHS